MIKRQDSITSLCICSLSSCMRQTLSLPFQSLTLSTVSPIDEGIFDRSPESLAAVQVRHCIQDALQRPLDRIGRLRGRHVGRTPAPITVGHRWFHWQRYWWWIGAAWSWISFKPARYRQLARSQWQRRRRPPWSRKPAWSRKPSRPEQRKWWKRQWYGW